MPRLVFVGRSRIWRTCGFERAAREHHSKVRIINDGPNSSASYILKERCAWWNIIDNILKHLLSNPSWKSDSVISRWAERKLSNNGIHWVPGFVSSGDGPCSYCTISAWQLLVGIPSSFAVPWRRLRDDLEYSYMLHVSVFGEDHTCESSTLVSYGCPADKAPIGSAKASPSSIEYDNIVSWAL